MFFIMISSFKILAQECVNSYRKIEACIRSNFQSSMFTLLMLRHDCKSRDVVNQLEGVFFIIKSIDWRKLRCNLFRSTGSRWKVSYVSIHLHLNRFPSISNQVQKSPPSWQAKSIHPFAFLKHFSLKKKETFHLK